MIQIRHLDTLHCSCLNIFSHKTSIEPFWFVKVNNLNECKFEFNILSIFQKLSISVKLQFMQSFLMGYFTNLYFKVTVLLSYNEEHHFEKKNIINLFMFYTLCTYS